MAKKKQKPKKTPKNNKKTEVTKIMNDSEYKNLKYMFIALLIASILFLAVYLVGFINILLK
ncbi:MAG: hypothetical protein HZC47_01340 [Methanobacterium sp.]|uniref:hypothetical protein n=1 Tax=Methanobacterium sp. TaxID=2164 RepID=UPI003D657A8C|nr:hypothetical protein [Methanobacterium sp.]